MYNVLEHIFGNSTNKTGVLCFISCLHISWLWTDPKSIPDSKKIFLASSHVSVHLPQTGLGYTQWCTGNVWTTFIVGLGENSVIQGMNLGMWLYKDGFEERQTYGHVHTVKFLEWRLHLNTAVNPLNYCFQVTTELKTAIFGIHFFWPK